MAGTSALSIVMGVATAWFVSMYRFPFRNLLQWMLILPLSIPTFIGAIAYVGLTDYAGPIRILFRSFETDIYMDVMTLPGAIIIMSLVLYPYVYLAARTAFSLQSSTLIEAARSLGQSHTHTFWKVVIPLNWSAIFAGLLLVMMEVMSDYGVVSYFGIQTFTTGIFRAWLSLGKLEEALILSTFLLLIIAVLLGIQSYINRDMKRSHGYSDRPLALATPSYPILLAILCSLPVFFGFIIPVLQLLWWASMTEQNASIADIKDWSLNTAWLALLTSILTICISVLFAYSLRIFKEFRTLKSILRLPMLGYAVPGAVIAVGIVSVVLLINPNLLYYSIFALLFGYTVRYFAVGYGNIESGFEQVPSTLDDAALNLGKGRLKSLWAVHLPILKNALFAGFILVFIDVIKELPLTLMLRPFNFESLSTQAFLYAKGEMAPQSAFPSLLIISLSTLPIFFIHRIQKKYASTSKHQ